MFDSMSLEQMRTYRGRQEVPADFDQFWANQKANIQQLPNYQLSRKIFALLMPTFMI